MPHRLSPGEVEVDESYSAGTVVSAGTVFVGRKGAGPGVKRLSSGFWNATDKVYMEIVPNAANKPLQATIQGRVALDRISTQTAGGATMG